MLALTGWLNEEQRKKIEFLEEQIRVLHELHGGKDRMIPLGERHLRRAIDEYMTHYHLERSHQGLDNELIDGVPESGSGSVVKRERLGGLLNSYHREAA